MKDNYYPDSFFYYWRKSCVVPYVSLDHILYDISSSRKAYLLFCILLRITYQ
uniref:Uncharacterized protein n=1 Tax=Lepeophtheirus salmonis TaxID=72036 RepID=A0A0K2TYK8_LEPSM